MIKKIYIEGMHCNHCSESVKNTLLKISGVSDVSVDLNEKVAMVNVDNVEDNILRSSIEDIGFDVTDVK